jgi:phenylpropionate dioxygenase-like ring-hydroxylating dioxygenase large terminal subunit
VPETRLVPPPTKGHVSVAQLTRAWYVACRSRDLGRRPIARTVVGIPMVLFRSEGRAAALLDRCPHRNVPLSLGKTTAAGTLECAYHGWQFDGGGRCRLVPGLCTEGGERERRVASFAAREADGFIWVYATPDVEPEEAPFTLPMVAERGYTTVVREVAVEASLHAALENALDVPHTAYLHAGLFRSSDKKNTITAVVTRQPDRVQAEYLGEPRPTGIVARLLSPSGGIVQHWDRFVLPSIAQVEYKLGTENHFLVTSICTPVEDFFTRMYAVVTFRTRIPGWLIKPLLSPLAMRIFRQDARILAIQTRAIQRFGGEQYMSTEIDVLGPHIWRLLRQAERAEPPAADAGERRITLRV